MKADKLHTEITNQIINLLEESLEFNKPWFVGNDLFALNPATNRNYTGFLNVWLLNNKTDQNKYRLNRWMTFKQGKDAGAEVRKGEKGTTVYFIDKCYFSKDGEYRSKWVRDLIKQKGEKGLRIVAAMVESGELIQRLYDKAYTVFNLDQFNNVPSAMYESSIDKLTDFEKEENAEKLIEQSGADIRYSFQDRAFYNYTADYIHLPERQTFKSPHGFYEVAFHELTHWTGAEKRLARRNFTDQNALFVDDEPERYAFEELVAELGSAYLMAGLGMQKQMNNSAAYIKAYLSVLKNDSTYIFKASAMATKAAKWLEAKAEAKADETAAA